MLLMAQVAVFIGLLFSVGSCDCDGPAGMQGPGFPLRADSVRWKKARTVFPVCLHKRPCVGERVVRCCSGISSRTATGGRALVREGSERGGPEPERPPCPVPCQPWGPFLCYGPDPGASGPHFPVKVCLRLKCKSEPPSLCGEVTRGGQWSAWTPPFLFPSSRLQPHILSPVE